jgi:hypothetical protein
MRLTMKLHSLLKSLFYKAGYSIKAIRPVPRNPTAVAAHPLAGIDVRAALHRVDPYEGFEFTSIPPDLHGWGGQSPVFRELILQIKPGLIVEVGTWKGASAVEMGVAVQEAGLTTQIVCVDTWLGALEFRTDQDDPERYRSLQLRHGYPSVYYQFLANVCHRGLQQTVTPFPQTSSIAALWFRYFGITADLIYIDASHEEEDVYEDLCGYWHILRVGGILFGDDYSWDGVRLAVDRFAGETGQKVAFKADKWLFQKGA